MLVKSYNEIDIKKAILNIVVFFDLFDYPPTEMEIKNNLNVITTLSKVKEALNQLVLEKKLYCYQGFYFLNNRKEIIKIRLSRYNYTNRKIKIAKKFVRIFSILPFIKMIALVNSIGGYNLRDGSDIDFFIVSRENRLWISRFFCTGIAKLLNSRPNSKTKKDKICLSFYLSENNLDLQKLKLKDGDPYFDFWEKNLIVLFDRNECFNKFLSVNQGQKLDDSLKSNKRSLIFLNYLEKVLYNIQIKIMPKELRQAALEEMSSSGVVIGRDIIKLYLSDRRLEIKEKYDNKIRNII